MKVELVSYSNKDPLSLISLAARTCYSSKIPKKIRPLDIEGQLFNPGHHTPFEHFFLTFAIEDIPVGDITFGLHLVHPFYNTDQRSGRYAGKMFWRPPFKTVEEYISVSWPTVKEEMKRKVINYLRKEISIFRDNHSQITDLARYFLKKERPFISRENLEKNAPKIAQEQLRMFIPIIFPTGLIHTIDLITLASLYRTAWSPGMREVSKQMAEIVVTQFPDLSFMFPERKERYSEWVPRLEDNKIRIATKPSLRILNIEESIEELEEPPLPSPEMIGPLDLLPFSPQFMNNNLIRLNSVIEVSLATMGQDQRHRGIQRGEPSFTRKFYLPPLLQEAKMYQVAEETMKQWFSFRNKLPSTLWTLLAPYGAMVKYKKSGPLNAVIHEQSKRLCWLAQEEIYQISCILREELEKISCHKYLQLLEPPCLAGKCPEGNRYCGRDLHKVASFFKRTV